MHDIKVLDLAELLQNFPARKVDAHKHLFGHVLVIGGDYGYPGAPIMAALGALRVGAGLVTVASHATHLHGLNAIHPELMTLPIDDPNVLKDLLVGTGLRAGPTVIILGPGLGRSAWSESIFQAAITNPLPLVCDADALFYVEDLGFQRRNWVITPHPGEAASLLSQPVQTTHQKRVDVCKQLMVHYSATVVLKGAGTLVGSPDSDLEVCHAGNPGMATAGMGDLLSGIIGGLIAQGLSTDLAAKLGVCLHAMAGDVVAEDGQRGLVTTDLLPVLRELLNN